MIASKFRDAATGFLKFHFRFLMKSIKSFALLQTFCSFFFFHSKLELLHQFWGHCASANLPARLMDRPQEALRCRRVIIVTIIVVASGAPSPTEGRKKKEKKRRNCLLFTFFSSFFRQEKIINFVYRYLMFFFGSFFYFYDNTDTKPPKLKHKIIIYTQV